VEEIISIWPELIWNHIDDDKYVQDWIDIDINTQSISDLSDEDDFRNFLEDDWSDEREEKVVKIWKGKQFDDKRYNDKVTKTEGVVSISLIKVSNDQTIKVTSFDGKFRKYRIPEEHVILVEEGQYVKKGDDLSTLAYEEYMFKDLDEDELKSMIEDLGEEEEYVEWVVKRRYEGMDAKDLIEDMYGDVTKMKSEDLYNIVQWYIDDEAIEKYYKDNEDFENKKEFVKYEIKNKIDLQKEILEKNKSNVLKLAQLYEEESCDEDMSNEYNFQKLYIEEYVKDNIDEDDFEKDEKNHLIATALKYLNDNFDLDKNIEEEYDAWRWMIDASNYNL
jgi:hypothetical protein